MEGEISTETKPRLFKSDRVLPVDTLIADPSITVIEIGEALGFLLSESCYDSETGNFILENVTWCRYIVLLGYLHRQRTVYHYAESN